MSGGHETSLEQVALISFISRGYIAIAICSYNYVDLELEDQIFQVE